MLKTIRAMASYHLQAANNSLNFLCRNPMATMMTVVVIAITLTLPALFWVLSDNLQNITKNWQRGGHISLYLKTSLSNQEQNAAVIQIQAMEGVGKVNLKTAEEGLKELQQQEGMHDIMRYLPENPLPAVIEVIPAIGFSQPFQVQQLYTRLQSLAQVEQAKLDMEWISRLHAILGFANKAAHAVMALLASAVVLIIGNTLRLAIHNRHEEIQVLKLIGATDPFIARPFLYSGIWYSLAGAILAVLFVNIFMLSFAVAIKQLAAAYQMHYPIMGLSVRQAYSLVLVSTLLGWLGARLSVKRQLASIEPYN
ncbi:permease-like cell division protein FtsX [Legionella jordanis]|uniref:Cell division protein FtsX n=1 Tax=Legionella jordanis TaxID=456 RepID=A0A0W0VBN8_9GAMM|nr:permease-like cell division protein FtsX [Legionella jordanis]KTD17507.1 cell division ATP transporter FtsX [Legionella jordanis]RMX05155.1 cell division protein FtsX [Legionella jordanis]RMX17411.1 cell division protein FtsX [Legionella jordanis]VEH13476.1 cell division transport system permease protein [Legionella jordanis]HAT8714393.1 cell division protein FtsX [Legionella jordanis]